MLYFFNILNAKSDEYGPKIEILFKQYFFIKFLIFLTSDPPPIRIT